MVDCSEKDTGTAEPESEKQVGYLVESDVQMQGLEAAHSQLSRYGCLWGKHNRCPPDSCLVIG